MMSYACAVVALCWFREAGIRRQCALVADKHNSDKSNIQDASRRVTITCETRNVAPIVEGLIHEARGMKQDTGSSTRQYIDE